MQDYAEAIMWYRLAAERGHASAQLYLGDVYAMGLSVPQSSALAYMRYYVSVTNGYFASVGGQDRIANRMTSLEISEAQSMARKCVETNYQECN